MHRAIALVVFGVFATAAAPVVRADVPVIDDDAEHERVEDHDHSETDKKSQELLLEETTVTNCNISRKERKRRLFRSPARAVAEDARNVALIKHYARKHHVPAGLALSVAHAESGISTCSQSSTGVRGVMQLTTQTGRGMGFDREINEENIEGGVKYLGTIVDRCGATHYACLASRYNGSTSEQQIEWAGKVARNHAWFEAYAGGSTIEDIASPSFKSHVDYGSSATRASDSAAAHTVDGAVSGIDTSTARVQEADRRIDALLGSVGASEIYQDAWDDNTQARALNAELFNTLLITRDLFNRLALTRMQMRLSRTSETAKTVKSDPRINPYRCDAADDREAGARHKDPAYCAAPASARADSEIQPSGGSSRAVRDNLSSIQNAANAAD